MSEENYEKTLERILENAKRIVPSLATPGYWRPAGTAKDPSEHVAIRKTEMDWLVNALKEAAAERSAVEQDRDNLCLALNNLIERWKGLMESYDRPPTLHAQELSNLIEKWGDS